MFRMKRQGIFSKTWRRFYIFWRRKIFFDDDNMLIIRTGFTICRKLVCILITKTRHTRMFV